MCFGTTAVSMNYMITNEADRQKRKDMFDDPSSTHREANKTIHWAETGTEIAQLGFPDDGNGRYTTIQGYGNWL